MIGLPARIRAAAKRSALASGAQRRIKGADHGPAQTAPGVASGGAGMGYKAFLSYSRADDRAANWLHRALDTYRTPRALVGEESTFGPIPPRLPPIFRDRTDMWRRRVSDRIESTLGESEALVVLCSPLRRSVWVNQRERFIALGRGAHLSQILDGEPECGDAARMLPRRSRQRPALADLRDIVPRTGRIGDGREMGKLKRSQGCSAPLDRLIQRERRRQRTAFMAMSGAAAIFAIVAAAALRQTFAAQRRSQRAGEQSAREIQDGNLPRALNRRQWRARLSAEPRSLPGATALSPSHARQPDHPQWRRPYCRRCASPDQASPPALP